MFRRKKSFTFIELVAVVIILLIIGGIGVYSLIEFYDLWYLSNYRMELIWSERTTMHEMTRHIREVKDAESVYTANAAQFVFDDTNNNRIAYQFIDDQLYKNGVSFMANITSGAFSYYDENGAAIAAPLVNPDDTNILIVRIALTLSNGGESISSQSQVLLRNLDE